MGVIQTPISKMYRFQYLREGLVMRSQRAGGREEERREEEGRENERRGRSLYYVTKFLANKIWCHCPHNAHAPTRAHILCVFRYFLKERRTFVLSSHLL